MTTPRLEKGTSDPIAYICTCPASHTQPLGGTVLLFYRYWTAPPSLPLSHAALAADLPSLIAFHHSLATVHNLNGKFRFAPEGYNITVGGTSPAIGAYITACLAHWSLAGLPLSTPALQDRFFKPTKGCGCVFGAGTKASLRIVPEITPMGVVGYVPQNWDAVEALEPGVFHELCSIGEGGKRPLLLDVRNAYESRIGYFVTGAGDGKGEGEEEAVRLGMRRFAQWPRWVGERMGDVLLGKEDVVEREGEEGNEKRPLVTYCTGGIRCEKATRWMVERMIDQRGGCGAGRRVCTLRGGIAAYLAWMDEEIRAGRKEASDSLFKGRNYVFDARGSVGLVEGGDREPVAKCHVCGVAEDRLGKCRSRGCHLVLVICSGCERKGDVRCCVDCWEMDEGKVESDVEGVGRRRMCACEREREGELWGGEAAKVPRVQGWRKARRKALAGLGGGVVDVSVKIIEPYAK